MSADNFEANKRGQGKQASKIKQSNTGEGNAKFDLSQLGEVRSKASLQALEPRVLLDAAGLVTGAEVLEQANAERVDSLVDDVLGGKSVAPWAAEESTENKALLEALAAPAKNEIVFIDGAVADSEALISSFPTGTEIYILDSESDGVEQIASMLEGRSGFDAIHIFSHGRSGTLDLGSTKLTEASMASRHADEMEVIRDALSENADILIYGCDFGANARGVSAIEALAEATGADIAASEDLTGNTTLGGDWDLEVEVGSVETDAITAAAFAGVLIDSDGDFIDDSVDDDDDDDNDGILDVDEGFVSGGLGKHIVLVVDESASIDATEASQIKTGLTSFINSQIGSGNTVSLIGMSDQATDNRFDHVENIFFPISGTDPTAPLDAWIATFRDGSQGVSSDHWGSGISKAATLGLGANDEVIIITDGSQGFSPFTNAPVATLENAGVHMFAIGVNAGEYFWDNQIGLGLDVDFTSDKIFDNVAGSANNPTQEVTDYAVDYATSEYDKVSDFSGLAAALTTLGTTIAATGVDTDGDGVQDHLDLDSDNDGISDLIESGQNQAVVDTNNDGRHDGAKNGAGVAFAANGGAGVIPFDSDFDTIKDFRDLDSDNDGIADAVEARPTAGYVSSTHFGNLGNNGVNDDGLYIPVDTGGSVLADYRDTDSDGDGTLDSAESGLAPGFDGNGDGIGDGVGASYADPDGVVNSPIAALTNVDSDASDVDYRSLNVTATAPIIDLNDNNTTADLSFTQTFIEGSAAVAVTDTDADVIDAQDNITSLSMAVGGAVDGNNEQIIVNGVPFQLGTNSVNTSTNVGGVPVTMNYAGGTLTITPTNGVTPLPQAFLDLLIRGITYEHTSENPTVGARTLSFTAMDNGGLSTAAPAVSTINVVPVNDHPIAQDDIEATSANATLSENVIPDNGNGVDIDPEGATLIVQRVNGLAFTSGSVITLPSGALLTMNSDGTYLYDPNGQFDGLSSIQTATDSFTYTISDSNGHTDMFILPGMPSPTATVTITINGVNEAPVAVNDGIIPVTGGSLTNVSVLGNDSDPENDTLTVQSITDPTNPGSPIPLTVGIEVTLASGTKVTLQANGSLNVTPLISASGIEAIDYTIADPSGATSTATITLNATAGVSTPIIDLNDNNTTANLDFAATFIEDAGAVNVTDTDADAIDLADDIVSVTIASGGVVDGADEIITLGGTPFPSGTNVVTPVQVTVGATTFNVTFIGGTFTLTNNTGAANSMPQADLDTLLRGITYENTSQTPTAGNRTLTFSATDAVGSTTATAAVSTINVVPVNDAPIAVDDGTFDVPAGSSAFLQPLNNDSDPEGDPLTITGIFDPAGSGTLVPLTLGTPVTLTTGTVVTLQAGGVLEVVAPNGAGGAETLDYQISDPNGGTDRANIALNRIAGIGPVIDLNGQPTLNLPTISATGNPVSAGGFGVGANGTWPGAVTLPGGGTADLRATVTGVDAPGTQVIFLTATDDPTVRIFTNFNTNDIGGNATILWEVLIGGVPQVTDLQFVISDIDSVEGIELSKTDLVNYILPDPNTLTPSETFTTIKLSGSVDGAFDPGSRIGLTYGQTLGAEITYNLLEGSRVFSHDGDGDVPIVGGNVNSVPPDINFEDTFTENGSPVAIGDTDTLATDADDNDLQSAIIVLTNAMTDDVLALPVLPAGMVGVIDTGTAGQITITLTGTATKAEYADAIRNITFENTGEDPDTTDRNIVVTVNDGSFNSFPAISTIHIIPVNDPPVAVDDSETTGENTSITKTAATGLINPNDTDPDAADTLTLTQVNGSAANVGSQITLASGALLTVQADGSYVYDPNGQFATLATGDTAIETFTYQISDGNGGFDTATVTITINGLSGAIVLTNDGDASSGAPADDYVTTYIENSLAVTIVDSDSSILDTEDDIVELVVILTDGLQGDTISFPTILPGSISAAVTPIATLTAPGTLTITFVGDASTTLADWDYVMQSMTFLPSTHDVHNPDPADRHITFVATDATNVSSNTTNTTIHVTPQNDPPTLDLDDGNTGGINAGNFQGSFTEDSGGTPIHSDIVMTDLDDTNFQTAMVTLTNTQTDDEFIINGTAVISGDTGTVNGINYVVSTGGSGEIIINWTGDATIADYDTALQSISFNNTSQAPDTTQRLIDVVVNDGLTDSPTRTAFIDVISVNDPPVPINPLTPGVPPVNQNAVIPNQAEVDSSAITTLDTSIYFNDPDDTVLTYSLGAGAPAWLSINATTGEIDGTPPADASQNSNVGFAGQYDVVVIAADPAGLTGQTTATFLITNPAPVAEDDGLTISENDPDITGSVYSPNGTAVGLVGDVDPDGDTLTVTEVDGVPANVGAPTAGSAGGLFTINSNGSYTFSDNGEFEDLAVGVTRDTIITYQISDGEGGFDTATVTVTVTGTNDTPIIIDPLNPGTPPGDPNNVITDVVTVDGTTPPTINVDDYIDDIDGDTLTFTQSGLPLGLLLDPVTGIISGTIDNSASQGGPNSDGIYDVTITGTDPTGATVTTTITYTITNPPPVAVDDASTGDEDTTQLGNVITDATTGDADTPPDSDPLTVTAVTGGTIGTAQTLTYGDLTLNTDGSWTFVPNATANALAVGDVVTETVTYTIDDGEGGTDTADLVITINGLNDAPVIVDPLNPGTPPGDPNNVITDVVTVDGTTPPTINVDDYIDDPDGDTLTFTQSGLPTGLLLDPVTGIISGTIDNSASQGGPNSDGIYDVTITGTDPTGATVTTTITYTITNPAPVAVDDASSGDEDTTQLGNVITDATTGDADTPPDSDVLTVTGVTGGTIGTAQTLTYGDLTLNTDGSWTFVPNATANALAVGDVVTETVTYTIDDGEGGTDTADLVITINGLNDAPIIVDPLNPGTPPGDPNNVITDVVTVDGTTPPTINVDDYIDDPDGDTLTFTQSGLPTGLLLDPVTGLITGTIDNSASQGGPNSDGIYDVTITGTDPTGATVTTTITYTITYTITNPAPVAEDDGLGLAENGTDLTGSVFTPNGTAVGLVGDVDPDGDTITVSEVDGAPANVGTAVAGSNGGLFTINTDGSYIFSDNGEFEDLALGETRDSIITYQISDGEGGFDTATVTVTMTGTNDAPIPVDPLDPNGPADPNNYIPAQTGVDSSAVTNLVLTPYFDDPDTNDVLTLSITPADLPSGLTFDAATNTISGTPSSNASQLGDVGTPGIYTIPVTATDPNGATFTTNVTYTITNPAPVAEDDALSIGEDGPVLNGSILTANGTAVGLVGDVDPDGDSLSVTEVNGNAADVGQPIGGSNGGTFIINTDGTYSFDPGSDFQDLDDGDQRTTTITYQISDGQGGFDTATVTVTVDGANDAPNPVDPLDPNGPADPNDYIPPQGGTDGLLTTPFNVTPYFNDVDTGDVVTFVSLDIPAWLTLDPNTGVITGTPPADASQNGPNSDGKYPFTIVVSDGTDTFSTVLVYDISNLPPVAVDDSYTAAEDVVLNVPTATGIIDSNDTDGDGDVLTVTQLNGVALVTGTVVTLPSGALLTLNDDGSFDYDPNGQFEDLGLGQTGTDSFTYQIGDGDGLFDTATVTITIDGANDGPIPVDPTQPPIDPLNPPAGTPFDPQTPFMPPLDPLDYIPGQPGIDAGPVTPLDLTPYFGDPDAPDAVTLSIVPTDLPVGVTFDPVTNTISGTPAGNASQLGDPGTPGVYTIPVTATDPNGATFTTNVVFTITNPAPVAEDDALIAPEDGVSTGSIFPDNGSGVDNDPDGDVITVSEVDGLPANVGTPAAGSTGGLFTINPDGTYSFDPGDDFNGLGLGETRDTIITYQISDGEGGFDDAVVTITVQGANDGPIPVDPTQPPIDPLNPPAGTPFDPQTPFMPPLDPLDYIPGQPGIDAGPVMPLDLTPYFGDPDAPDAVTLSVTAGDLPAGLTFDPVTNTISGTPSSNASQLGDPGTPGVYTIPVTATDPNGATFTTNVVFTITNPAPVAEDDALTAPEDGVSTGSIFPDNGSGVDNDPDGDVITVSEVDGDPANVGTPTAGSTGGLFTINPDGTYSFDPGDDFNGLGVGETQDTTITYQISDGEGGFDDAVVTITVQGANDGPIPVDPTQPPIDPLNPPAGTPFDPQTPFMPPLDPLDYIPGQPGVDAGPVTPLDLTPYFGDPDAPDAVTLSIVPTDLPVGVTFDPVTNTISGTPAGNASQLGDPGTPGVYTIPVTATDPNGATFTTNVVFTITNPPPVVTVDIPDQVGIDGYDVTIDTAPHFDDPDNDDLTYGAVGLPTGLTIDPLTGLITGTLDGNASNGGPGNDGFYPVTITVDDGEGGTVSTTFIFDANPVVVSFPDVPPVGLPLPPDGPDDPPNGDPGLTVTGTVNGFTPLGNSTALGPDLVVTNAVNGIRSLGGGTALDSNQPITEAIRNQIETDRETGIGFSIYGREGIALEGPYLYLGGQIDTGLHSSRGDITVRTMVYQTHMYVDLMTFGNAPLKDWSVRMSNGQPVPSWINMPGSNLVLIERVADVGRVNLDIIAHLKTGEKVVFPVHLDMTSGEIVLHARAYQISSVETVQNQQTASATPLSDEITRLANAGGDATRALFNT